MSDIEHRTSPRFVLVILSLASITILTLGYKSGNMFQLRLIKSTARDLVNPPESAIRTFATPLVDFVQGASSYSQLKSQNRKLQAEVAKLRSVAAGSVETEQQLAQLTKLQHLSFANNLRHIPAEVMATTTSNFEVSISIDKGTTAGVRRGMPVVAGGGLAGRIVETSKNASVVLLITDPTSAIGVRFGSSVPILGVASGQGAQDPLSVQYVSPNKGIRRGQDVVTTQVRGGTMPPGIPVGTVSAVHSLPGALQQNIEVKPFVPLNTLEFVDVLRWYPGNG